MHDPIDGHGLIDEFVEHRIWKPAVASAAASGAKPTSTAMVQLPQPSGHLIPRKGRLRTGSEIGPAPLNLCKLPGVNGHVFRPARDIFPEILDQLEFLGGGEAEDRACIGCHGNCSAAVVIAQPADRVQR